MREKIKKIIKGYLPGFITGMIVCATVSVIAMTYFPSNDVTYDNKESGLESTNVQGAIDELYKTCTAKPPATDTIKDLVSTNTNELYTDEHGDIRYYGKIPNNYVSFNNELWRIIGVIDEKVKIIRSESIGYYAWASNGRNNWNNASLKNYLNGEYYNSIDETYRNMISEETYYLGGPSSDNNDLLTSSDYYNVERDSTQVYSGNPASTTQKIGLMYPSDYGYAAGSSCLSTALYDYSNGCYNSDYLYSGLNEWLQAPIAYNSDCAANLFRSGFVYINTLTISGLVRPVLYLNSNVQITGGDGTSSNPFHLSL